MPKIVGFRVQNYGVLKDVALGDLQSSSVAVHHPLTPLTAVIGKNGVGKSTLFGTFGFLSDCLAQGVEAACDANGRGGFERLRTKGQADAMRFTVRYIESATDLPLNYQLSIDLDSRWLPYVRFEALFQDSMKSARKFFLVRGAGAGIAWKGQDGHPIDQEEEGIASTEMRDILTTALPDR